MGKAFSLLLPVWAGDRADHLSDAFRSTVYRQTRRPAQVVIVRDGPVSAAVAVALDGLVAASPVPVELVVLEHNLGLGPALDAGLARCAHDIVARMDADDIALPHRFEVQVPMIAAGVDLLGSSMLEFGTGPDDIVGRRVPPIAPDDIIAYARFHQPFHHPTVVYRRSAVQAAGGYRHLALMEDYLLFAKMIKRDVRVANVAEPLVLYRVGAGAFARRGGVALLKSEWALQRRMHEMGFTSRPQFARNVVVRGGYRLVPEAIRKAAYRRIIARKGER